MNKNQTVNVEIGDKEWEGIYSNFVIITHSRSEFILDFARMLPGAKKAKVFSRIVMTPQHAKGLLSTLENNITKFEKENGKIPLVAPDSDKSAIGFQTDMPNDSKSEL